MEVCVILRERSDRRIWVGGGELRDCGIAGFGLNAKHPTSNIEGKEGIWGMGGKNLKSTIYNMKSGGGRGFDN